MAPAARFNKLLPGAAATLLSAALFWFATGLFPRWPLAWLAPAPVLLFACTAPAWAAALAAFVASIIGGLNHWHYFTRVLTMPAGVAAAIIGGAAGLFVLETLFFRALMRRGAYPWATVAFPSAWVVLEYLVTRGSVHGTIGSLAYTQLDFLPLLQLAALTGPWGISFVVTLFTATVAVIILLWPGSPARALGVGGTSFAFIAAILLCGVVRLAAPQAGPTVKVGLVASDAPGRVDVVKGDAVAHLFSDYAAPIEALAARGAQFVVLPEELGVLVDPPAAFDTKLQMLSNRLRVTIVAGLVHVAPPSRYNEARIYTPGAPVLAYHKQHLLPPFETKLTPGNQLTPLSNAAGPIGVAICKDMDFPRPAAAYGDLGIGLLLVPAWDFVTDRWSHGHIAIMRGVESGFAIARSAKQGFLTVSDNRGRVLAETTSYAASFATLLVDVPTTHADTLFLKFGDWFVALAATLVALCTVRLFWPGGAKTAP